MKKKLKLTKGWIVQCWSPMTLTTQRYFFRTFHVGSDWKHMTWVKNIKGVDEFYLDGTLFMTGKIVGKKEVFSIKK